MAKFTISMSVEIVAEDYDEANEIKADIFRKINEHPEVQGGPYEIDVEQMDGFEDEENIDIDLDGGLSATNE
jgi:hypothetical protein